MNTRQSFSSRESEDSADTLVYRQRIIDLALESRESEEKSLTGGDGISNFFKLLILPRPTEKKAENSKQAPLEEEVTRFLNEINLNFFLENLKEVDEDYLVVFMQENEDAVLENLDYLSSKLIQVCSTFEDFCGSKYEDEFYIQKFCKASPNFNFLLSTESLCNKYTDLCKLFSILLSRMLVSPDLNNSQLKLPLQNAVSQIFTFINLVNFSVALQSSSNEEDIAGFLVTSSFIALTKPMGIPKLLGGFLKILYTVDNPQSVMSLFTQFIYLLASFFLLNKKFDTELLKTFRAGLRENQSVATEEPISTPPPDEPQIPARPIHAMLHRIQQMVAPRSAPQPATSSATPIILIPSFQDDLLDQQVLQEVSTGFQRLVKREGFLSKLSQDEIIHYKASMQECRIALSTLLYSVFCPENTGRSFDDNKMHPFVSVLALTIGNLICARSTGAADDNYVPRAMMLTLNSILSNHRESSIHFSDQVVMWTKQKGYDGQNLLLNTNKYFIQVMCHFACHQRKDFQDMALHLIGIFTAERQLLANRFLESFNLIKKLHSTILNFDEHKHNRSLELSLLILRNMCVDGQFAIEKAIFVESSTDPNVLPHKIIDLVSVCAHKMVLSNQPPWVLFVGENAIGLLKNILQSCERKHLLLLIRLGIIEALTAYLEAELKLSGVSKEGKLAVLSTILHLIRRSKVFGLDIKHYHDSDEPDLSAADNHVPLIPELFAITNKWKLIENAAGPHNRIDIEELIQSLLRYR